MWLHFFCVLTVFTYNFGVFLDGARRYRRDDCLEEKSYRLLAARESCWGMLNEFCLAGNNLWVCILQNLRSRDQEGIR